MPYASVKDLPSAVRAKLKPKKQRQWMEVWNSSHERHGDEARAFAEAWGVVNRKGRVAKAQKRISKASANYRDATEPRIRCGSCTMFVSSGNCTLVRGGIEASGLCDYFEKETDPDVKESRQKSPGGQESKQLLGSLAKGSSAPDAGGPHSEGPMTDNIRFFLPILKVDKKKRTVSGYASTETRDMDGEIVSLDAVKKALPGYMAWRNIREMHRLHAIGAAQEAHIDKKGLYLTAKIVDDSAWEKCVSDPPVYNGFSIGGRKIAKVGDTITELDLTEISIVDRPANPDCRISVAKSAGAGIEAHLIEPKGKSDPQARALKKAGEVISLLSKVGPPAARDGFSLPAKKVETSAKPEPSPEEMKAAKKAEKRAAKKAARKAEKKAAAKAAKTAAKAAQVSRADVVSLLPRSVEPSFLALSADGASRAPGGSLSGHDEMGLGSSGAPREGGKKLKKGAKKEKIPSLKKSMRTAGDLSYAFDTVRRVQRDLVLESKREGGDRKDQALAKDLGPIAQGLAAIIGQKAKHEGEEALDLSDADDRFLYDALGGDFAMAETTDGLEKAVLNIVKRATTPSRAARLGLAQKALKKARDARKECAAAIEEAHKMVKASYMAKAAKKDKKPDDDGDFDHAGMIEKLQKAYGAITKVGTFSKAAREQIKKASSRSGQRGQETSDPEAGFYEVPPGITDLSPAAIAGAAPGTKGGGSQPPLYPDSGAVYPGKSAMARFAKGGAIPLAVAEVIAENMRLSGANEALSRMPAQPSSGRRPYGMDITKFGGGAGFTAGGGDTDPLRKAILDAGVNPATLMEDEAGRGAVIGHYLLGGSAAKSVIDPAFHGTAGIGRKAAAA